MAKVRSMILAVLMLAIGTPAVAQAVGVTGVSIRLLRDERLGPNRVAVLESDLAYCYPPSGELIIVPAGYVTDFASVPSVASLVVERYGESIEAAIVHDWLYAVGEPDRRDWADAIFRFALGEQGVGMAERNVAHSGVRVGGGAAYGRAEEWTSRFYAYGRVTPPRFAKPVSAVVAVLENCDAMEDAVQVQDLIAQYGSARWPRAALGPQ